MFIGREEHPRLQSGLLRRGARWELVGWRSPRQRDFISHTQVATRSVKVPKEEVEDEMNILRKLDHPNIVRLFEWFECLG